MLTNYRFLHSYIFIRLQFLNNRWLTGYRYWNIPSFAVQLNWIVQLPIIDDLMLSIDS